MLTYWGTVQGRERRRLDGTALVVPLPNWTFLAHVEPTTNAWAWSVEGTRGNGGWSGIVEAERADTSKPGDVCAIRAGNGWELAYRAG